MREEKILPYSNVFWFHLKNVPEFFLLRLFYTYFEFLRCSKYVLYLALEMLLLQPCHFRPWTEHRTFSLSHNNLNVPMDNSQLTFQRIKIMIDNMDTRTIYQLFVRSVRFLSGPARAIKFPPIRRFHGHTFPIRSLSWYIDSTFDNRYLYRFIDRLNFS